LLDAEAYQARRTRPTKSCETRPTPTGSAEAGSAEAASAPTGAASAPTGATSAPTGAASPGYLLGPETKGKELEDLTDEALTEDLVPVKN